MKSDPRKRGWSGTDAGAALVIVLAFIVLLTALMVLFFTQAVSYRNMGNSSFNNFRSTALAQSGLETVVGDLEQEMTNGSTVVNYGTTTYPTNVYYPTTNFYAVPQRQSNIPASIPNLVRVSERSDPIASPGVLSRASADSSTNVAASGQYLSPARWNQHYLIARASAGTTPINTTPISDFTNYCAPDWVYVTSTGPTVITAPSTKVIGRYAYAIYDEGGLLDANVAGFPSNTSTNAAHPSSPVAYETNAYGVASPVWGSGFKGTEAFADLTAIGFTQTQIDQLVGWRQNATAQPTGTYNAYTFNTTAAVNYHDWMVNATNGFLTTSGHSWNDPTTSKTDTDQVFASRQALINYVNDSGVSQDVLQYLGTFTRSLEQPSYIPPVGRPMVQSAGNINAATFGTGNDARSVDRYSTTPTTNSPVDINPSFLSERVGSTFTRYSDNTAAVPGEPLVKYRFPLSRLSLFPTNMAAPSTANATLISEYFGLTYQAASGNTPALWFYNQDGATTAGIDKLSVVASQNREPNFFELLKAAINVGSVGKGDAYNEDNAVSTGTNTGTATWATAASVGSLAQAHDTLSALQILQIGANIIDQSKSDNFSTRIQFAGDTTVPPNVACGSEDLPYLYRIRNWITQYSTTQVAYLIQPELWDPYSYSSTANFGSSSYVPTTGTPKIFRVRLEPDPSVATTGSPVFMQIDYTYSIPSGTTTSLQNDYENAPFFNLNHPYFQNSTSSTSGSTATGPTPAPMTFRAGELNGCWGFREPTLLAVPALCTSSDLNGDVATPSPTYTDVNTKTTMAGFTLATFPTTVPATNPLSTTPTESLAKLELQPNYSTPPGYQPVCLRMYLDYQDPTNNSRWINYDWAVFSYMNGSSGWDAMPSHMAGQTSYAADLTYFDWFGWVRTDPRTPRWAMMYTEYFTDYQDLDTSNNEFETQRSGGGISYGSHLGGGRADLGFSTYANYVVSATHPYRGAEPGYAPENSVRLTYQTDTGDNYQRYNLDPDGVPRRNMGGYASDVANGGVNGQFSPTVSGLPMNTALATSNFTARPTILHRPFRSVAELGYAFRDTPWGNINFSFPESGDSALLDVFCINDPTATSGLVAGKVDLNTRQANVLAALMSGALCDKDDPTIPALTQAMATDLGTDLVARTSGVHGPLTGRADMVGTWTDSNVSATSGTHLKTADASTASVASTVDPNNYFTGFSSDIGTVTHTIGTSVALLTRQRESAIRALADVGNVRTWNLLIDLTAQSGQFPPSATGFPNFVVEGEKHYWLHVSLDRYTGKVVDSQLEVVSE